MKQARTLTDLNAKFQKRVQKQEEITEEQAWEVIEDKYDFSILQNVIGYVEKEGYTVLEKPTIPQFVADWIEEAKDKERTLCGAIIDCPGEVEYWLIDGDCSNQETFARAWLDGYTVEKEQKYYVLGKYDTPILFRDYRNRITETSNLSEIYPKANSEDFEFTEQEIKDYDPRYWAFRKPVEVAE